MREIKNIKHQVVKYIQLCFSYIYIIYLVMAAIFVVTKLPQPGKKDVLFAVQGTKKDE